MSKKQRSDRYRLLLYREVVGRHAQKALLLACLFLGLWILVDRGFAHWLERDTQRWLFAGGLVCSFWTWPGICTSPSRSSSPADTDIPLEHFLPPNHKHSPDRLRQIVSSRKHASSRSAPFEAFPRCHRSGHRSARMAAAYLVASALPKPIHAGKRPGRLRPARR